jgi:hypothetical protein
LRETCCTIASCLRHLRRRLRRATPRLFLSVLPKWNAQSERELRAGFRSRGSASGDPRRHESARSPREPHPPFSGLDRSAARDLGWIQIPFAFEEPRHKDRWRTRLLSETTRNSGVGAPLASGWVEHHGLAITGMDRALGKGLFVLRTCDRDLLRLTRNPVADTNVLPMAESRPLCRSLPPG